VPLHAPPHDVLVVEVAGDTGHVVELAQVVGPVVGGEVPKLNLRPQKNPGEIALFVKHK